MSQHPPGNDHAHPPRPPRAPAPRIRRRIEGGGARRGELIPLAELPGVALAADEVDIRGWTVRAAEGRAIGRVDDLLVDADRMRVRYLAVALAERDGAAEGDGDDLLLTPVDTARLDHARREVRIARSVADIAHVPHRTDGRAAH